MSTTTRRTEKQRALLKKGYNPIGGKFHPCASSLDDPRGPGRKCSNCLHLVTKSFSSTFHKCAFRDTGSAASDIRKFWPACKKHEWENEIARMTWMRLGDS